MDFSADAEIFIQEFANCTVTPRLVGVAVKEPFPGIFDESAAPVQAYEAERVMFKPLVTVSSTDFNGIDSKHTLEIRGKEYTFDGKPRPDGAGLTVVTLAVKK